MHAHGPPRLRVLGDATLGLHGPVTALDVSPSGRLLLAATDQLDGDAAVFDLQTHAVVDRVPITASHAVFVDESTFVTAYAMTRWHRLGQRELVGESTHYGAPIAFDRSTGLLALTERPEASVVAVLAPGAPGAVLHTFTFTSQVKSLAFGMRGTRLAIGCAEGAFVAHLDDGGRLETAVAEGRYVAVAWSGETLIMASGDRTANVWRAGGLRQGALQNDVELSATSAGGLLALGSPAAVVVDPLGLRKRITLVGPIGAMAFVGEKRLAVGVRNKIRFLDVAKGAVDEPTAGHDESISRIATTNEGRVIATSGTSRGTIHVWDATSGALVHTLGGHDGGPLALSFTPDGELLASGGRDGRIVLHDVASGERTGTARAGHGMSGVALTFTRDRRLFVVHEDGAIAIHELDALGKGHDFARVPSGGIFPPTIAVDAEARFVAVAAAGTVTVFHADGPQRAQELVKIEGEARLPAFAPDAPWLALRHDQELVVMELPTGKVLRRLECPVIHALAFLPGGSVAVVPYVDASVEIIDVATGERRPVSLPGRPRAVAAGDASTIAVGFADGTSAVVPIPLSPSMQRIATMNALRQAARELLPRAEEHRGGYRDGPAAPKLDGDVIELTRGGQRFTIALGTEAPGWALRIARDGRSFVAPQPSLIDRARRFVGAKPSSVAPAVATLGFGQSRSAEVEPAGTLLVRGPHGAPPDAREIEQWLVALAPVA